MQNKTSNLLTITGVILGLISGAIDNHFLFQCAEVVSGLFMNLLKLVSLPLIFLGITATVTGMRDWTEVQYLGRNILKYTILTTVIAASIALLLFLSINPVHNMIVNPDAMGETVIANTHYADFAMKIVPANFAGAFVENNVLGVAFIAFLLSIATLHLPNENKKVLQTLFSSLFSVLLKMTSYAITLLPLGIWAFMTLLMHDLGGHLSQFQPIMLYVVVVVGANLIQGLVVIPALLKLRGLSPLATFRGASKALLMAFMTKSSNATLPLSISVARENLDISKKVASTALPLCSVINMNGCAAFILATVLFVGMSNGIHFSTIDLLMWVALATLAAIGNAGVPMGCYFLSSAFLVAMNVPLYVMGLILPIYAVIDMIETALNVWSDISITAIVDKEIQGASSMIEHYSEVKDPV